MDSVISERTLPHNLDAERAVLGAVLIDNEAYQVVATQLTGEEFFRGAHRRIYACIKAMFERGTKVDLVLLRAELDRVGSLEEVGGSAYVASLIDGVPKATNIRFYSEIVREKARLRSVIFCANRLLSQAYEAEMNAASVVEAGVADLMRTVDVARGGLVTEDDAMRRYVAMLDNGASDLMPTGYADLDALLGGLKRKELIVVAARPSVGKTSFALGIARHLVESGRRGIFFSMEMGEESLASRLIAWASGVPSVLLERRTATDEQYRRVGEIVTQERAAQVLMETTARTVTEAAAWCRLASAEAAIDFAIFDYMQLMSPERRRESEEAEMKWVSRRLKELCKEQNIAVVALSQLSRAPEKRRDPRPTMADLRGSGAIEQDCDMGLLLFRGEMYKQTEDNEGVAEVIVAKNRNGPTGVVKLAFLRQLARFVNLAQQ